MSMSRGEAITYIRNLEDDYSGEHCAGDDDRAESEQEVRDALHALGVTDEEIKAADCRPRTTNAVDVGAECQHKHFHVVEQSRYAVNSMFRVQCSTCPTHVAMIRPSNSRPSVDEARAALG